MVAVEVEAKLIAPEGIVLPDLSGLLRGSVAQPGAIVALDARYYDTSDLRLARTGTTLRYRSGDGRPGWTLKLPRTRHTSSLSRTEIDFDHPPDRVPDAAVDLVTALTRGRRLEPVCDMSTVRRPIEIRDSTGRLVGVVVDDTVSATSAGRNVAVFCEIEVEVHENSRRARRLLDAAVSRLAAAGAKPGEPTPKLIRVLGPLAAKPPDVSVASLDRNPGLPDVIRHALATSALSIVRHDPGVRMGGIPEEVHQLRVGTRRLRSDLRSFAPLLDDTAVAAIRREIGWLGDVVGAVRDLDVLAERLSSGIESLGGDDHPAGAVLLDALHGQRSAARDALLGAMRSPRYLEILDTLVEVSSAPPLRLGLTLSGADLSRQAKRIVRRSVRDLAAAVERLGDEPGDSPLHRVRILTKRARYAAEAVTPLAESRLGQLSVALSQLQGFLGDYNDTVIAETWLRAAAERHPDAGVAAGLLIAVERRKRAKLRRRWPVVWRRASKGPLADWL